jgi:DNA primase
MIIYQLVFGTDSGQVHCVFHDDQNKSAGIGPNGEYNCFTCGAKAKDEVGFIAKYFGVSLTRALRIKGSLFRMRSYNYQQFEVNDEQRTYLNSIGIDNTVIDQFFFQSGVGKLMFRHTWNTFPVGYTWFNSSLLSNHNASAPKYKYDGNTIAGLLTPYDDVFRFKTLLICEGEKDMLTARSKGINNAVAKIGGANSHIIGGINLQNKQIIICYDCDDWGRDAAVKDATDLTNKFNCKVKVIDLGLQNGEDLNDYFMKYNHTKDEFKTLAANTPIFIPTETQQSRFHKLVTSLSAEELQELTEIIKNITEEK